MVVAVKNAKALGDNALKQMGVIEATQNVADIHNAMKNRTANPNQKGLASVGWATCCPRVRMSVQAA